MSTTRQRGQQRSSSVVVVFFPNSSRIAAGPGKALKLEEVEKVHSGSTEEVVKELCGLGKDGVVIGSPGGHHGIDSFDEADFQGRIVIGLDTEEALDLGDGI